MRAGREGRGHEKASPSRHARDSRPYDTVWFKSNGGTIAAGAPPHRHQAEHGMPVEVLAFLSHGFAMRSGSARPNLLRRLAVLAALVIDCALFVAPRSRSFVFWYADSFVYMFRETSYECDLFGEGLRALPWLPFFGHATGDMYWLPQWECSSYDPMRWGLFVQLVALGACYVLGRPRGNEVNFGCAFASLQTLATAILVLSCTRGIFILGLLPLLFAVALWRAPPAWRRILVVSAAFALALEVAYVLVRFPDPKKWSWGLLLFLLDPEGFLLPQLAGTVWFIRATSRGLDIPRVALPITVAAAAMAVATAMLRLVACPLLDYSWDPGTVLWIVVALLLALQAMPRRREAPCHRGGCARRLS